MKTIRNRCLKSFLPGLLIWGILFSPSSVSGNPGLFRFSIGTEPPALDPSLATDGTSILIIENLMEGLTQFNRELKPEPAVADRWEVSGDGTRYLFFLKKNVFWSDGVPLTAGDFEYAWKRLLNPATASEYAYFLYDVENAEEYNTGRLKESNRVGVQALSPFLLEVRLKKPVVYFTSLTTFSATFPLRKDLIERYGNHWTDPGKMAVNGPYQLKEWRHEYKLKLEINPLYYGPKPLCKSVDLFIINERNTALTLYETGSLDMVSLPPEAIPYYQNHPEFKNQPLLRGYYYGFNVSLSPFQDVRVRRAFSMAIDREEFPRILKGGERPAYSWVPPGMPGYNEAIGLRFNPAESARLLSEAGYLQGVNFPRVTLMFNTDTVNSLIAENIQAQLKRNLNVSILLDNQEWKVYLKRLQVDTPQIFRLGWGADYPDPDTFMNLFITGGGNNHTHWGNRVYDQIILKASFETDLKKRLSLYDESQRILTEKEVPMMPLFFSAQNFLIKPYVRGLETNSMELIYFKKIIPAR